MALAQYFEPDVQSPSYLSYNTGETLRIVPQRDYRYRFLKHYCDLIRDGRYDDLFYGERVPEVAPIVVTMSLQFDAHTDVPFDDQFVRRFVQLTQSTILSTVELYSDDNRELACVYCESDWINDTSTYTVNAQLRFPMCRLSVSTQKKELRRELLKAYGEGNLLSTLYKPVVNGNLNTVVDACALDTYTPMYGSGPLRFRDAYGPDGLPVALEDLGEIMPLKLHPLYGKFPPMETKSTYWLPLWLSTEYNANHNTEHYLRQQQPIVPAVSDIPEEQYEFPETDAIVTAKKALTLIGAASYDDPETCEIIGKALYHVYEGSPKGAQLWYEYCRDVGKTDEDSTYYWRAYRGFKTGNTYNELQLMQIAKEDSPAAFKRWYQDHTDNLLAESVRTGTIGSVARAFIAYNWDKYVYSDGVWYIFNGTYLERQNEPPGYDIGEFRKQYDILHAKLASKVVEQGRGPPRARGGQEQETPQALAARNNDAMNASCARIVKQLDDPRFVDGVVKSMRWILSKRHRYARMNHNHNLFVTADCVLVSRDGGLPMKERAGRIQDYSVLHTSVFFDNTLTWESPIVKDYMAHYRRIFPDEEVFHFLHDKWSMAMRSCNSDGRINLLCGSTRSGKTQAKNDVDQTFGCDASTNFQGYSYTYPSTTITGARTYSSSATPDLAHANDKKMTWFEEPEESTNCNEGLCRQESGGGIRFTRFLNRDGGNNASTAMMFGVANEHNMPRFSPVPENKIRLVKVPCVATFLPPEGDPINGVIVPATEEERRAKHIYVGDNNNHKTRATRCQAQLWVLVQYHSRLNFSNGIRMPRAIITATEHYWATTDPYTMYVNEFTKSNTNVARPYIDTEALLYVHRAWRTINYPNLKQPTKTKDMLCFNNILGVTRTDPLVNEGKPHYVGRVLHDPLYAEYFADRVRSTTNVSDSVSLASMYTDFKGWYRNITQESAKVVPRYVFAACMMYHLGNLTKGRYPGWCLNMELNA